MQGLNYALESNRIRPLAERLDRVLYAKYGVEGYLTDDNKIDQLVMTRDEKAIMLQRNDGEVDSDCAWVGKKYLQDVSIGDISWKKDIINAILWMCSDDIPSKPNQKSSNSKKTHQTISKDAEDMSTNDKNKLGYAKDIFDIVFRIMDDKSFPQESRMDLLTMAVEEFLGLPKFKTLFENIQKKRETTALNEKLKALEEMMNKLQNPEDKTATTLPKRTINQKPKKPVFSPPPDDEDQEDSNDEDLSMFEQALSGIEDDDDDESY